MHCLTKGYSIYAQLAAQNGKELCYKKWKLTENLIFQLALEREDLFSHQRDVCEKNSI